MPVERMREQMKGDSQEQATRVQHVWVRDPAGDEKQALLTKPRELPNAAVEELARIARFALIALHELRTPITSALASLGALVESLDQEDNGIPARLLRNIFKSVMILKRRTDDLQDIVDFRAGIARLQPSSVDVGKLVKDTLSGFSERAQFAGVQIEISVSEDLPRITADASRLSQVVRHFTQNALDYASEGRRIEVKVHSCCADFMRVDVQDHGPGIDPEKRMRIFHPEGGTPQSGEVAGMGIGLELCKVIIEQHGGRILVDCEQGKGSRFSMELPLHGSPQAGA